MGQLPLPLKLDRFTSFETFVADSNETLVRHLEAVARGERSEVVWICGARGRGKSHLLQATCRAADRAGTRAMYLPLDAGDELDPDCLLDLDSVGLLALDQIDAVAGRPAWEERLFAVLEGMQSSGRPLLLAADTAPSGTGFALADLASRAAAATVYRLNPLSDDGQRQALEEHARGRGLELDEATARYLLTRVEREVGELYRWLDRLDRASLVEQRRLTVPFVRKALESEATRESASTGEVPGFAPVDGRQGPARRPR